MITAPLANDHYAEPVIAKATPKQGVLSGAVVEASKDPDKTWTYSSLRGARKASKLREAKKLQTNFTSTQTHW